MAKKQYYTSFDELMVGLNSDLADKFDLVCDKLVDEIQDMIDYWVYQAKPEQTYMRTYELSDNIVRCKKNGLNAEFYLDDKPIVTIDNPYHHVLEEGGTMEEMVDVASFGRMEDIKAFVAKRFPQLYREAINGKLN